MKYILAIETTGAFASVALAKADWEEGHVASFEIACHIEGHDRFSHLQNLTPQIRQAIEESGLSIGDVAVIAVSRGPGSFTGIRIGVSTARALSQVLGIPCAAVPSLEAMALRLAESQALSDDTVICPIIDARRSQIYGGGFAAGPNGELQPVIQPGPYTVTEFMEAIQAKAIKRVSFMGDGIDKYQELIEEGKPAGCEITYADEAVRYQDAQTVARIGAAMAAAGELCDFAELEPVYMRAAEAERKLKEKQKNG
ncbi:MAG: tRNA (adenosine(37)-N6)-threonylcarbamoyltransferase complex dimerization subunit type 1 TsaB [Bacillota bacterium]|nr:tRNA (adenosine(37)-N6)-threonylcarbamoyltransferase complex dimerization subunit type 1 TsaB [Bacillota bacterium]